MHIHTMYNSYTIIRYLGLLGLRLGRLLRGGPGPGPPGDGGRRLLALVLNNFIYHIRCYYVVRLCYAVSYCVRHCLRLDALGLVLRPLLPQLLLRPLLENQVEHVHNYV